MSRLLLSTVLAFAMVMVYSARADGATESLKQGDPIGAFYVTKVAGAEDDGVEAGQELCYRCRYGSRPMVMVFARDTGGKVTEFIKQLDAAVGANDEAQLKGLVTLMGQDASVLKDEAIKIAKKSGAKHIPLVVAKQTETGPANYKLSSDAAVTIVVANDSQVVATHIFAADEIDIAAVIAEVKQMLN